MYKVIKAFADLQDRNYVYHTGDTYPREGTKASQGRIDELSGVGNRLRMPLIEAVEPSDEEEPVKKEETPKKAVKSRKKTI